MNKKNRFILFVFLSLFLSTGAMHVHGQSPVVFKSGKAEITLKDYLHHRLFWWPGTLLRYPVVFHGEVSPDALILKDKHTGRQVPFQISDFQKKQNGTSEAILYLMTDLPSGGERAFVLQKGTPENFPPLAVSENNQRITIKTDKIEVQLPVSLNTSPNVIPGPVLSMGQRGNKMMGASSFLPGKRRLEKLETKVVNKGPLFVEMELVYRFTGGAKYQANIRCVKGYDFVEIRERMEGFSDKDQAEWEIRWEGFNSTHRQAPNHPYGQPKSAPGFKRYDWEKVDQDMLHSHHGIMYSPGNGKIPFEIGIYGNWPAERTVTSTVFWDEKEMQSVGAFTKDIAFWDDREYSIWHSSGKLNVKFYYRDDLLRWIYPVYNGSRSTALSCYAHQNDIDYMEELERLNQSKEPGRPQMSQLSYNTFLQNRHSTIDLDKVKDWDLTYPEPLRIQKVLFSTQARMPDLERGFFYGGFSNELAVSGPCQNSGYSPVPARSFYNSYVIQFNQLLTQMTAEQRARLSAMFLLHTYMAAGEEFMPMRAMLSGHPNFLADVRTIPAWAAFLFPEHSQAKNWSDMFGKYIELNTHYHTRPDVVLWGAQGGRWTENLGAYIWAFLRPTSKANYLTQNYVNGKNHMANDRMAQIGSWMMNSLSAPYDGESLDFYRNKDGTLHPHFWGIVTEEPARVHPPQGAHAARRKPLSTLWLLGEMLQNYHPLLGENLRSVSNPKDQRDDETAYNIMYPENCDTGTPPDFKSIKLTGYGIILRAATGTKDELSIHLQQIDRGPNYRWGFAGEGGCGNIFFYAAGKSYSHNGREDSGDRRTQDTDLATNFGAFKYGRFKSIGRSELTRPLYDLSYGQFAELTSNERSGFSSWPEYQSRSVMLVGSDYFITYDDVYNNNIGSRFSWFTHPLEDMPEIKMIKSGGRGFDLFRFDVEKTEHIGRESKGLWYDGQGDMMAFVSHRKDFKLESAQPYGCIIVGPNSKDYIFRNDTPVEETSERVFSGTAGFIRERTDGQQEIALFHGTRIGNNRFEILTNHTDAGISALYTNLSVIKGEYYSPEETEITFRWAQSIPQGVIFYVNGRKQTVKNTEKDLIVTFPAGKHIWNISTGMPVMCRPEIKSTRNEKNSVTLTIHPVAGAQRYRYEYSINAGVNWKTLKEQAATTLRIQPEGKEKKGYVRVVSLNDEHSSEASVVYPVYFTSAKPHYPDGLKLRETENSVTLSWGQVLGCQEYRLYRRIKGENKYQLLFKGPDRHYDDKSIRKNVMYEYAVTAVDGNGESAYSHPVDNNPDSWLNFTPVPGEPFRREDNDPDNWLNYIPVSGEPLSRVTSRSQETENSKNKVEMYYPE